MPAGDGTGPQGMGSRTGRGAGFCSGFNVPGFANPMVRGRRFAAWGNRAGRAGYYPAAWQGPTASYGGFGVPYGGRGMRRRWW